MIVTRIERQKKHPDRCSLFIDGSFVLGVRSEVLLKAGLRRGDDITQDALERLRSEEEFDAARTAAVKYAGRRRRTEHEIRKKLSTLSFGEPAIGAAIDRLRASGLVDDRAYVRAFIHDSLLHRPAGGRMIAHRLRGKGLDPDLLREEISSALGPAGEEPLAGRCASTYLATLARREASGKVYRTGEREALLRRYLAGRGFSGNAVDRAVKSALSPRGGGE
jgi:regulatory protein